MTIEQIPLTFWLFLAGQCLTIAGFFIKFFLDHKLLKQRVETMEKNCDKCKQETDNNITGKTGDLKADLDELKTDVKDMKKCFDEFKTSMISGMSKIETLISNKTVQL